MMLRPSQLSLTLPLRGPPPSPRPSGSSMHTFEHGKGVAEGFKSGEAVAHGDGSGWTFRGVPLPAAEASDDPTRPGQGIGGMRVLLLGGSPFETRLVEAEGFDLVGREDLLGRGRRGAAAGADELHDAGRRQGGEKGEFAEGLSALDLAGLDVEPLALEGPEQLLDVPAPAVPVDDLQSGFRGVDGMGGQ